MGLDRDTIIGLGVLITLLILVSAISFILSSIEGFITGVFVIFLGFLLSFFRDDIKKFLGISKEKESPPPKIEKKNPLYDIEKNITKGRKKVAKAIVKYETEKKTYKKPAKAEDIYQEASELLSQLHRAKTYAIEQKNKQLIKHYDDLIQEIEKTRNEARQNMIPQGD